MSDMRAAILTFAGAALVLAACASDEGVEPVRVAEGAMVAKETIVGPVLVEADRLVIQREGNEMLLAQLPGKALVGAPDGTDANPVGFLRRALSADVVGDEIVIATEPAALEDVLTSGALQARLDPARPAENGALGTAGTGATDLSPLAFGGSLPGVDYTFPSMTLYEDSTTFNDPTGVLSVRGVDIRRSVTLMSGSVRFNPTVELDLAFSRARLSRFTAIARGELAASFKVSFDMAASAQIDRNAPYRQHLRNTLRAPSIRKTLYQSPPQLLGVQFIGPVPVVETVRYRLTLECDLDLDVSLHGEASLDLRSTAAFGATYRDGTWRSADTPTLTATPAVSFARKGDISGACGVRGEVGFYFYDLAGPTLALTPYVDYDVASAGDQFSYNLVPGFRGTFGGSAQVLGRELLRGDISLFDVRSGKPFRGTL
jgi:hypothetical protein